MIAFSMAERYSLIKHLLTKLKWGQLSVHSKEKTLFIKI